MKKMNKKGFTLIELLAVIVILSVLLAIAVPSVTKYINTSKKNTYVSNAQSYASTALQQMTLGNNENSANNYKAPVNPNEAIVITFTSLKENLEKGGQKSPYGGTYNANNSFVVIANVGTAESPKYKSYIAALDSEGYGIGEITSGTATAKVIEYNSLTSSNIIQVTTGVTKPTETSPGNTVTTSGGTFKVVKVY